MEDWVNIPRSIIDLYYRYRMPVPQLKIEKKKTIIVNINDIAKSLERTSDIIIKFISLEIGVTSCNNNSLNGEYDVDTILNCLDKFIEEYVLCCSCNFPCTYFESDNASVILKCLNCNDKFPLDMNNKFNIYILENLPTEKVITMMLSSHSGRVQNKTLCPECGTKIRKFKNGFICQKNHKILPGSDLYSRVQNS